MNKICANCGKPFDATSGRQRFCSSPCRMRANYVKRTGAPAVVPIHNGKTAPSLAVISPPGDFVNTVRAKLAATGKLDTVQGQLCMELATDLVASTGAARAALSREFTLRFDATMSDAEVAADPIDELRARREARNAR